MNMAAVRAYRTLYHRAWLEHSAELRRGTYKVGSLRLDRYRISEVVAQRYGMPAHRLRDDYMRWELRQLQMGEMCHNVTKRVIF